MATLTDFSTRVIGPKLYALSRIPAGHVTAFLGLSPVTATVLSTVINDELLTISAIIALGLVVAALLVLVFPKEA